VLLVATLPPIERTESAGSLRTAYVVANKVSPFRTSRWFDRILT